MKIALSGFDVEVPKTILDVANVRVFDPKLAEESCVTETCTRTKYTVASLQPLTKYYVRIAAVGGDDRKV